ncbi:protein-cysteine N-palmitoyltransferase Rasp-like [Macrosteles quadrilineatus]|uniref:protein-cysteine N-palmitoyltransferase Rasp-like n=1 Tax=Macrosteles quadrilineatus TaxID=74068 RepID=UPI0023E26D02|nr:protein-cysteine N-palmitoyltransferase Rasp-like [Macrosteles quadrilineatus]
MGSKLHKFEILFYGSVWVTSVCYSIYKVYLAGTLFNHTDIGDDFSVSWHGFKKDIADYEWTTWLPFIIFTIPPWILAHLVTSEMTRWIAPKGIPAVYSTVTFLFLSLHFSPAAALFALGQVVVYYVILRLKSVTLVWMFGVPFLLLSCFALQEFWEQWGRDDQQYTMMVVSTTWLHLHCTSYSLEALSSHKHNLGWSSFYDLLGYSLYFPTYFLGPFIIYSDFGPHMYRPFKRWTKNRVLKFLYNMIRYLFWAAVTEASLYFLYIHALQYHMSVVVRLGAWTLYGLGFLLGQFFCLKYIVVYGLIGTIANFEGYSAPPPPKCVARIHLYTDMWRVFDVGFYNFIHRYIYSPLCAGRKEVSTRLMASAVCFCFVFLWHGVHLSIFIWSLLNFLGVSLVSFGIQISKTQEYKKWEMETLSVANARRLTALLLAPMFIMGPISSFYFFSGMNTGNVFITQLLFFGSWTSVGVLMFVAYCMCQVSIEIKTWEEKNQKNKSI